jgi:hypothetical protein
MPLTIEQADPNLLDSMYMLCAAKKIHALCPALQGEPAAHAARFMDDMFGQLEIDRLCERVNRAADIGSLFPKRFLTLLPVPVIKRAAPDFRKLFGDLFRFHQEKSQTDLILFVIDKHAYHDPEALLQTMREVATGHAWMRDREPPAIFTHIG